MNLRTTQHEKWPYIPAWAVLNERNEFGGTGPLLSLSTEFGIRERSENEGRAASEDLSGYRRVVPGDLVVNRLVARDGAFAVSGLQGLISPAYWVLRARQEFDTRFVNYLLHSSDYLAEITARSKAMPPAQFDLPWEQFRTLPIAAPDLATQRRIVDYLDTETARIDALITKKQRLRELLQIRWRAATASRLRELANERGSVQLRHLVRCLDGRRVPLSSEERAGRTGSFPYYGASGVVDHVDGYLFDETLVLLGEDGAQLGAPDYPIAQIAAGKIWVNNHAHVLRPTAVDPEFLVLHLNTFDRVPYISGGTREKITQEDMNRIPVPHLTLSEQRAEAARLGVIRAQSDNGSMVLTRQIDLLSEYRQSLITAAVTGELKIPEVAA